MNEHDSIGMKLNFFLLDNFWVAPVFIICVVVLAVWFGNRRYIAKNPEYAKWLKSRKMPVSGPFLYLLLIGFMVWMFFLHPKQMLVEDPWWVRMGNSYISWIEKSNNVKLIPNQCSDLMALRHAVYFFCPYYKIHPVSLEDHSGNKSLLKAKVTLLQLGARWLVMIVLMLVLLAVMLFLMGRPRRPNEP